MLAKGRVDSTRSSSARDKLRGRKRGHGKENPLEHA